MTQEQQEDEDEGTRAQKLPTTILAQFLIFLPEKQILQKQNDGCQRLKPTNRWIIRVILEHCDYGSKLGQTQRQQKLDNHCMRQPFALRNIDDLKTAWWQAAQGTDQPECGLTSLSLLPG